MEFLGELLLRKKVRVFFPDTIYSFGLNLTGRVNGVDGSLIWLTKVERQIAGDPTRSINDQVINMTHPGFQRLEILED